MGSASIKAPRSRPRHPREGGDPLGLAEGI